MTIGVQLSTVLFPTRAYALVSPPQRGPKLPEPNSINDPLPRGGYFFLPEKKNDDGR